MGETQSGDCLVFKVKHIKLIPFLFFPLTEEKKIGIHEIANQRGILKKTDGWKIHHIAYQFEDLVSQNIHNLHKIGLQAKMCCSFNAIDRFTNIYECFFSRDLVTSYSINSLE